MTDFVSTFDTFDNLAARRLYRIVQARMAVFVVEQDCVYQDLDDVDLVSRHLTLWKSARIDEELLSYCRIVPPGVKYHEPSIGRVISTGAGRGAGLGREVVRQAIEYCERLYPAEGIRISAQDYLRRFYGEFGFVPVSETYLEDNIEHVEMLRVSSGS